MNPPNILVLFPDSPACTEEKPEQLQTSIWNHWRGWEVNQCKDWPSLLQSKSQDLT